MTWRDMNVEPPEAFALFYKNNSGPVFRALLARTLDRAAAEDATAEAFARAFAHWHSVAGHPNPRAWVLRVAWNYHTSMWRAWDGRRVADPPPATPPAADQWVDPDLIAAIAGLPYGQREVLVLAALGGLRPLEIAKVLGKAASTVRGRLSRARTTLRRSSASPAARRDTMTEEQRPLWTTRSSAGCSRPSRTRNPPTSWPRSCAEQPTIWRWIGTPPPSRLLPTASPPPIWSPPTGASPPP